VAGLGKHSWHDTGLEGDRTSERLRGTDVASVGLVAGTSGVIARRETRHVREGKVDDAVVTATREGDEYKAADDALRDSVCSPTNTLLN